MQYFLTELKNSQEYLVRYLRHPIAEIRNLPDWSWRRILIVHVTITMILGLLTGLLTFTKLSLLFGVIVMPILTFILISVSCFFFYYAFQIFAAKTVSFRALYLMILLANIPFFIFQIGAHYFVFLQVIGLAFSAFILTVGFVEVFGLSRKLVLRLILGLFAVILAIWIWGRIDGSRLDKSMKSNEYEAPEVHLGQ